MNFLAHRNGGPELLLLVVEKEHIGHTKALLVAWHNVVLRKVCEFEYQVSTCCSPCDTEPVT